MKRRAQAALEFLSTYGFAFLIILVMIGALTYFGVLNPSRFLPERCLSGQEFQCEDFLVIGTPATSLEAYFWLTNNAGSTVTVTDDQGGAASIPPGQLDADVGDCTTWNGQGPPASGGADFVGDHVIALGSRAEFRCLIDSTTIDGGGNAVNVPGDGEKIKVDIGLNYTKAGGPYTHQLAIELFATQQ